MVLFCVTTRLSLACRVSDMEKHGIIHGLHGSCLSRRKAAMQSGEPRFRVDLRDLNARLKVQDTPLPRCDDAIDQLGRALGPSYGRSYG